MPEYDYDYLRRTAEIRTDWNGEPEDLTPRAVAYIGSSWNVFPASDDDDADEVFEELLNTELEPFGGSVEYGEGDPTDVFFVFNI